jgi:hypothetical protein
MKQQLLNNKFETDILLIIVLDKWQKALQVIKA